MTTLKNQTKRYKKPPVDDHFANYFLAYCMVFGAIVSTVVLAGVLIEIPYQIITGRELGIMESVGYDMRSY